MRIGKIEVKRRVWFGLVFVVASTGVWWAWTLSQERAAAVAASPKQAFVQLAGSGAGASDQVLRERAAYFDPTPLFFPTEWNFGQHALRETMRRQSGDVFGSIEAKLTFAEQNIKPYSAETTAAPELLTDVLGPGNETPFAGLGHIDVPRQALAERSACVEVRTLSDSKLIVAQSFIAPILSQNDFAPLEFLVAVSSAGLVGDPVLVSGSGREDVDVFLHNYLVKTFRVAERLDPGRYRVLVGP